VGLANSIPTLKVDTPMGHLDWSKGPVKNVVDTVIPGCQWYKSPPGSKFPLQLLTTEHADDPSIPIEAKLKPYGSV